MFRSPRLIYQPVQGIVVVEVFGVVGEELLGLGPQRRDGCGGIVEVDGESVCLVVVLHVAEDVVVNITEEVDVGLDAPVILGVGEGGVFVEEAAVPATHLVVGDLVCILDFVFLQDLDGFLIQIHVDPGWYLPVLRWYKLCYKLATAQQNQPPTVLAAAGASSYRILSAHWSPLMFFS